MPPTSPSADELMPGGRRHFLARMGALGLVLGGCAFPAGGARPPCVWWCPTDRPVLCRRAGRGARGLGAPQDAGQQPDSHYAVAEVAGRKVLEGLADTDGGASALECPLSVARRGRDDAVLAVDVAHGAQGGPLGRQRPG